MFSDLIRIFETTSLSRDVTMSTNRNDDYDSNHYDENDNDQLEMMPLNSTRNNVCLSNDDSDKDRNSSQQLNSQHKNGWAIYSCSSSTRKNVVSVSTKAALCLCMFVHSYLLVSVFPYSPFMAIALLNPDYYFNDPTNIVSHEISNNTESNNSSSSSANNSIEKPFFGHNNINEDTAGTYAGLLASSFMFGRATTSLYWGTIADRYGRVRVLYCSLFLSSIFSLWFGFITKSYLIALLARFLLGCSNGIMGTVKTIVSELNGSTSNSDANPSESRTKITARSATTTKESPTIIKNKVIGSQSIKSMDAPTHAEYTTTESGIVTEHRTIQEEQKKQQKADETSLMTLVMGMWGWGFLIAPAYSGFVSEPVRQYYYYENNNDDNQPTSMSISSVFGVATTTSSSSISTWFLKPTTWTGQLLRTFPFVLPNITGSLLCWVGIIMIYWYVPETLSQSIQQRNQHVNIKRMPTVDSTTTKLQEDAMIKANENENTKATVATKSQPPTNTSTTISYLLSKSTTMSCLLMYWFYSFVNVAVDEIVPLFLISTSSGFGIKESQVGLILSACGIIFVIGQYNVCMVLYNWYGTYGSIRIGIVLLAPMVCFIPVSLLINQWFTSENDATTEELHWVTFWFLAIVLSIYKLMALVFFTNISVACNNTVSATERATMNGLSVLGGSIAKGLGPTFAGVLATQSVQYLHQYASILMFGTIAILSACVAVSVYVLLPGGEHPNGVMSIH